MICSKNKYWFNCYCWESIETGRALHELCFISIHLSFYKNVDHQQLWNDKMKHAGKGKFSLFKKVNAVKIIDGLHTGSKGYVTKTEVMDAPFVQNMKKNYKHTWCIFED